MLRWRHCWVVLALVCLALASCLGQKNDRPEPTASPLPANGSRGGNTTAAPSTTTPPKNVTTNTSTAANKTTAATPPAPAPPAGTTACPASLLPYLDQQQQPAVDGVNTTNSTSDGAGTDPFSRKQLGGPQPGIPPKQQPLQPLVPPWPPVAIKQGLTCTMEVSHLAAALPGSADVCNVILIKNNLLSVLYSWQLMWESATDPGLEAVAADGDVLITSSGAGPSDIIRVVNGAQSPNIDAQGGKATFVLQTHVSRGNSSSNSSSGSAASQQGHVSPAMGSVYLNGLQCTRLPLRTAGPSMQYQDCAATRWDIDSNGTFILPILSSLSAATSNNSNGSFWYRDGTNNAAGNSNTTVDGDTAAALRWLSCTSHYCCGLQVVPPGSEATTTPSEPAVGALDGPADANTPTGNATAGNVTTAAVANITTNVIATSNSSNQTAATPLATPDTISNSMAPQAQPLPAGEHAELQHPDSNNTKTIAAAVAGVVAAAVATTAGVLLFLQRRKAKQREQQRLRLQQLMQGKDPEVPTLATAALIRGSSNASTESSGSQAGAASTSSGQGSNSLVSLASTASWQQQHSSGRPPLWVRQQPSGTRAGQAAGAGGTVWRAGSWQGADTAKYLGSSPPHGSNLFRSSSSPQPFLQQQHPTDQTAVNIATLEHSTSFPPHHRRQPSNPNTMGRAASLPPTGQQPTSYVARGSEPEISPQPQAPADDALSRSVSGATSSHQSLAVLGSTAGSGWTSLRQLFGSNRPPRNSSTSAGSSSTLGRSGSMQAGTSTAADSGASAAADHAAHIQQQQVQMVQYQRQQLQLIQETAPLSSSQLPVQVQAGVAGISLRRHASGPVGSFGSGEASTAGRVVPLGASLSDAGQQAQAVLGITGAAVRNEFSSPLGGVSRRISPIVSVLEDASSATSNESFTPAAWHHTDRQLLEEQPGWLNIDFSQEVRLERKLGEGGFGRVFRARWKDDVIAVKLVPFMSLVTHHNYSVSLVSAAEPAAGQQAAAGGLGGGFAPPAAPSAAAELMNVGMQFSAASLRAIKQEIKVLSQLSHENIVAFKGACLAPPHICILEELAEAGSLHARLYSRSSCRKLLGIAAPSAGQPGGSSNGGKGGVRGTSSSKRSSNDGSTNPPSKAGRSSSSRGQLPPPMSLAEVLGVAIDVASAMQYLHALKPHPVVHRDLKPQNVLLDLQGRAKVCDFGISKMKDASLAASSTRLQAGTPAFMAPEQFEGRPVTDKVDVFAFGVMLWECCEQQQPWKDLTPMQIIYAVGLQKERLGRPATCLDDLWGLIEECWQQQPEMRPSFNEILRRLTYMQANLERTSCVHHHGPVIQNKQAASLIGGQVTKDDVHLGSPAYQSHDSCEQVTTGSLMGDLNTGCSGASQPSQQLGTTGSSQAGKVVAGGGVITDVDPADDQDDADARVSVSH